MDSKVSDDMVKPSFGLSFESPATIEPQLVMPAIHTLPFPSQPPILPAPQQIAPTVEDLQKRVAALALDNDALKQWGTSLHVDLMTCELSLLFRMWRISIFKWDCTTRSGSVKQPGNDLHLREGY